MLARRGWMSSIWKAEQRQTGRVRRLRGPIGRAFRVAAELEPGERAGL